MPKENRPGTGLHYNPYFANLNLAMAAPLTADGQVTYDDGTKATKDQMAKDVAAFLTWTAEPKMEARKTAGWAALIFLIIFTGLTYLSYRTIWADKRSIKSDFMQKPCGACSSQGFSFAAKLLTGTHGNGISAPPKRV